MMSLKFVVIRADVLEMPVLHPETVRDCPELLKAETLIEVPRMRIALDDGVELQNAEAVLLGLFQAIFHELFADVLAPRVRRDCVACV